MASLSTKKIGCWFAKLLDRKQSEAASLPLAFGSQAQNALDSASPSSLHEAPSSGFRRQGSLTREGITLADLKPGECGYIDHLAGTTKGRLRLLEMGMTPGTHVQITRAAAFGGPLDVQVRGYQLSIRREEAALVWLGGPKVAALKTTDFAVDAVSGQGKVFTEEDDLG